MSAAVLEAPVVSAEGAEFTLEVYSKPSCVQCTATYRALDKKGVVYVKATLDEDAEKNADAVREFGMSLGVTSAPLCIVRAADGSIAEFWGGFNPTQIEGWAERLPMTPEAAAKKAAEIAAAEPALLAA
jgi:glutaredoxin-like protein NrdH